MDPKRWEKIDKLVDEALAVPESGRESFVIENCGDPDMAREVLELLHAARRTDDFLEASPMDILARSFADEVTEAHESLLGKTLGNYKVERVLGMGGMGEVYLAYDYKLRRRIALKILPAEYGSNDERVRRFEREARAVSRLNHPNIVTLFDIGNFEGLNYIATEYVEGETIREMMNRRPRIRDVIAAATQVCDALAAAHKEGIIHRDIKPENIMIRGDGYAKVLDFGLAKLVELSSDTLNDVGKTTKGIVLGTPAYMSPEQVSDDHVDHRTDLWAIGVILYEAVTGIHPFKGANRPETFQAILSRTPPPASSLNSEVSAELDRILEKALEKDPDLSYQTAHDLKADLKRVKREMDSSPSLSSQSVEFRAEKAGVRRFGITAGVLALIAVLTAGFLARYLFYRNVTADDVPDWSTATHMQVTNSPWIDGYPSLSPDGKNIVYASENDGDRNIYLQRVNGEMPVNLTPNSPNSDTMPAFSPDGEMIAFRSERQPAGIYVMEQTGENARRVSDIGFHPSWSHDGEKIIVSDRAAAIHSVHTVANSSLWQIDVASGTKERIETGGDAIMPKASPNGHRIAFWFASEQNSGEIATIPAAGGEPMIVASNVSADWNPVWSPDGRYLYFASNRGGNMNFWRIAINEETGVTTGEPEPVPTPSKYCRHISLSRDGKMLAYVRYESRSNLLGFAFDPAELKMNGPVEWITRGNNEISYPDLSPDGRSFVVRVPGLTTEDLVIMDRHGNNRRSITSDEFAERFPRWSPDGRRIAFHSNRTGRYQIWAVNADGTSAEQLTETEKSGANMAVFSPDGTKMAFTEIDGQTHSSYITAIGSSAAEHKPQPLAPIPGRTSFSVRDWSADGKRLLVIGFEPDGDESGISVYEIETAQYRTMSETGTAPQWLGDSRHFIFTDRNGIYICDSQSGSIKEIYRTPVFELQQANISNDDRFIYFRYLQIDADVWLIDSNTAAADD